MSKEGHVISRRHELDVPLATDDDDVDVVEVEVDDTGDEDGGTGAAAPEDCDAFACGCCSGGCAGCSFFALMALGLVTLMALIVVRAPMKKSFLSLSSMINVCRSRSRIINVSSNIAAIRPKAPQPTAKTWLLGKLIFPT